MSEQREPMRLRDDPSEDEGLRAMLDAARGEAPPDAMLDRVLAGVLARGGGGGGGPPDDGGATQASMIARTASIVGVGVVAVLVASRVYVSHSVSPHATRSDAAVIADASARDSGPGDAGTEDAASDARASDAGHDAWAPRTASRPPPVTDTPPGEPALAEGPLLLAATRARATDPARSLALALEHRARFPSSAGSEDREALIVLDLVDLSRANDARLAAEAFRARWPRSPHLSHVDAAIARIAP